MSAQVDAKALARLQWLEALGLGHGDFEHLQRLAHGQRQALGTRRGAHACVRALEQRIAQQQAQPRHGLAGGGLGHAQLLGRPRLTLQWRYTASKTRSRLRSRFLISI